MNFITIVVTTLKASVILTVFCIGLRANPNETFYLIRRPSLLLRSILAMNVIVPLFAIGIATAFDLQPAVKIALVALALSPIPPLLPRKQLKAGGEHSYVVGLLALTSLLSLVFIPLTLGGLGRFFSLPLQMPPAALGRIVVIMLLAPLAAGILVKRLFPGFTNKIVDPLAKISLVVLVLACLPILFTAWPAIVLLCGNGTILAIVAFTLIALAAGHWLGGPAPETRSVLSLASASRHPGIALAIATVNFPQEKRLVVAAIFLCLIVSTIVSLPLLMRRKHYSTATSS